MKKRILSLCGILLLFVLSSAGSAGEAFASDQPRTDATIEERAAGFITDSFNVDATIQKDNSYLITEKISVDFIVPSHGIYREIPVAGSVVSEYQGQRVVMDARMKIDSVSVEGAPFTRSMSGDNVLLKIGDPNRMITGPMTYTINYRARLYDDGIPDYDLIYYNVLPTDWFTPIRSVQIRVAIPGADTDVSGAELIAGLAGSTDTTTYFDTNTQIDKQNGYVLFTAKSKGTLPMYAGATFLLRVPQGFFQNQLSDAGLIRNVLIVFIAAPLSCLILWFVFGRDKKPVVTVEFYPPEGLPSGEIGYLVDGKVQTKDLLSMILWWASQGLLTIDETSEGKFTIKKKGVLPAGVKLYQKTLWDALFVRGDRIDIGTPDNVHPLMLAQSKRQLIHEYKDDVKTNLYTKTSMRATVVCALIALAPVIAYIAYTALAVAPTAISNGAGNTGSNSATVLGAIVGVVVLFVFIMVVRDLGRIGGIGIGTAILMGMRMGLLFITLAIGIVGSAALHLPEFLMAAASVAACVFFAYIARRRTEYYEAILGRIRGFKNFIKVAENDRMQKLFADDPQYYYKTLPYAWVFGLSDIWAKKFENMITAPPDWYSGYYGANMFSTALLLSSMNRLNTATVNSFRSPVQSGGGGGFGGGFSGGGFGGGGGGRW